ncbi:MAG: GlxA family transcriptional regulator [Gammaproteobacteria bacterium]
MSTNDQHNAPERTKTIGFVVFPGVELIDLCGPLDVFSSVDRMSLLLGQANRLPHYRIEVFASQPGPVVTSSGLAIVAGHAFGTLDIEIDTLIVPGGDWVDDAFQDWILIEWLKGMAPRVRRLVSVCTGAFLLAASGLLEGRRVTTHWFYSQRLAREYPTIKVDSDQIFIRDGAIYTSGGITAGIDLALALLEEDLGRAVASTAARMLVMFLKRPGDQSQFSTFLTAEAANRRDISELQAWISANPDADLSVEALAERIAMSPRNFARLFQKETGTTPAKFVEQTRLEHARCKLLQATLPIEAIAEQCGFGNPERMRRSFQRLLRVSPYEYRTRFRSTAVN